LHQFNEIKNAKNIPYNELIRHKELGKGGFGTVYQGKYRGEMVAIKELNSQGIHEVEEFQREVTIMSKVKSNYIVEFLGASFEKPLCLVMEYMPGGTLDKYLQAPGDITWKIRYQIAIDIGKGIEYLHGQGVIHCDLKSPNVLLTADKRAKLSDFGISKVKLSDTQTTIVGGDNGVSLLWAAPEVLSGEKHAKTSDIYSCGAIFLELGTRKYPFVKDNDAITKDTPARLGHLIKLCWNKQPDKRPTADDIVEELLQEQQQLGYKMG
jgi:serine/threonine protein kinase